MPIDYKYIYSVPDVKDSEGFWLNSYTKEIDGVYYCYSTRSAVIWRSVNQRCDPKQQRTIVYNGCTNDFENYQALAEWCQDQYGYMHKEANGKFWALDKDLLIYNNRSYSPETCLFVPTRINTLLVSKNNSKSEYPCGVTKQNNASTYKATVNDGSRITQYLGSFKTPMEAHRAWQLAKIEQIKLATLDPQLNDKIISALWQHAERIQNDFDNGLETLTYNSSVR